jgi:hypothetical protein
MKYSVHKKQMFSIIKNLTTDYLKHLFFETIVSDDVLEFLANQEILKEIRARLTKAQYNEFILEIQNMEVSNQ